MTLVVTTASAMGITVVGDRAVTRTNPSGLEFLRARKVWYAAKANVALAFWGNANFPDGESLEQWARRFVAKIKSNDTVTTICDRLVSNLNPELESLGREWHRLRRGIHVSGYENEVPVIYHVHTGDPRAFHHPLEVHRDYPDIHGGRTDDYCQVLKNGGYVQLRNGYHPLFELLAQKVIESCGDLSSVLGAPVPARSLAGQAAFDEAIVRLAADVLKAAQVAQGISVELDVVAFTHQGRVSL